MILLPKTPAMMLNYSKVIGRRHRTLCIPRCFMNPLYEIIIQFHIVLNVDRPIALNSVCSHRLLYINYTLRASDLNVPSMFNGLFIYFFYICSFGLMRHIKLKFENTNLPSCTIKPLIYHAANFFGIHCRGSYES